MKLINLSVFSASSNLNVVQQHQGAGGDTQETSSDVIFILKTVVLRNLTKFISQDEPHILKHQVTKPSKNLKIY